MKSLSARLGPAPITVIHALAAIGVLFWIAQSITAFADDTRPWEVLGLGVVLGGAHVAISRLTSMHSTRVYWAMWFVLISDSLLTIFVNWHAIALVGFTVVLLLLLHTSSAREWFTKS
jgi:hypothetical protein